MSRALGKKLEKNTKKINTEAFGKKLEKNTKKFFHGHPNICRSYVIHNQIITWSYGISHHMCIRYAVSDNITTKQNTPSRTYLHRMG